MTGCRGTWCDDDDDRIRCLLPSATRAFQTRGGVLHVQHGPEDPM